MTDCNHKTQDSFALKLTEAFEESLADGPHVGVTEEALLENEVFRLP